MSQTLPTDIWGQDIALNANGQALVAANGEIVLTQGTATGVQDIMLRLFTYDGSLFYDTDFGSRIFDWVYEENTAENQAGFLAELILCVEKDPRVVPHSIKAAVLKWNENIFIASLNWNFIDTDQPYNLVMQLNKETKDLIISDADPNPHNLSTWVKCDF